MSVTGIAERAALKPRVAVVQPAIQQPTVIEAIIRVATGTARTFYSRKGKVFTHERKEAHTFNTFPEACECADDLLARHDVLDVAFIVGAM